MPSVIPRGNVSPFFRRLFTSSFACTYATLFEKLVPFRFLQIDTVSPLGDLELIEITLQHSRVPVDYRRPMVPTTPSVNPKYIALVFSRVVHIFTTFSMSGGLSPKNTIPWYSFTACLRVGHLTICATQGTAGVALFDHFLFVPDGVSHGGSSFRRLLRRGSTLT